MMMKRFMNKKVAAIGLGAGLALGVAGGAFAYFQTSGSGQGSTTAGTAGSVALQASIAGAIVPGDGGQSVTFTATNANTTSAQVTTISFASVTSSNSACQAVIDANPSQFSMADVSSGTVVPASTTTPLALTGTGTLVWADSTSQDQTACAGAPLTLHVTSS
jgi:hypothetical protein